MVERRKIAEALSNQPTGEMTAYRPTWRDALAIAFSGNGRVSGLRRNLLEGVLGSTGLGSTGSSLIDFTPAGVAFAADETARALDAGNYGDAAMNALGAIPGGAVSGGVATALAGAKPWKNLASRSANMYNPPAKSPRAFEADYPQGARSDEAGRLLEDIEGRPLVARHVVGRTHEGGGDAALPADAYDSVAEAVTGGRPQAVASRQIGGDAGQYVVTRDRRSGDVLNRDIFVDKSLSEAQAQRVAAHEIGHAINDVSGTIPVDGLDGELRRVYNDLNNPQSYGKKFGPEQNRYKGETAKRELLAESIRAYMTDPNYIKTVAPDVASRIRKYVNSHPEISKVIQFNSLGGGLLGLGAMRESGCPGT